MKSPVGIRAEDDLPGGHETILLVEDDDAVRDSSAVLLRSLGYKVFVAEDAPAALGKLATLRDAGQSVDLVLSDVVMPSGLSGFELADQIRENYQRVKILLVTGYSDEALAQKLASKPKSLEIRVLHKPYKLNKLATSLREILDGA